MAFDIKIDLPSGKQRRVKELTNRDYLNIIKYCANEDHEGLNTLFEELLLDADLNIFDRFYMLIYWRMIFVDSKISITKGKRQIDVNLITLLDKLESNYRDFETTATIDGVEITLNLPHTSYFSNVDDLMISTIHKLSLNGNSLDYFNLTNKEKQQVLDNLPATVFTRIKTYVDFISRDLLDVTLIEENASVGIDEFNLSIIGNGVMQFISSIYATDISSFFQLIYTFQNTITPGSDLFFDISPIESKIMINHHSKRVKDENDQLQKQNQR